MEQNDSINSGTDENNKKASNNLITAALIAFLIYVGLNISVMAERSEQIQSGLGLVSITIGAIIGSLIWPMIVVGIFSIWKRNRNSVTLTKVFFGTSVVLILMHAVIFAFAHFYQ